MGGRGVSPGGGGRSESREICESPSSAHGILSNLPNTPPITLHLLQSINQSCRLGRCTLAQPVRLPSSRH